MQEDHQTPVKIALLRAVNVGGTGLLAMRDLQRLCTAIGFNNVRTYAQSGNVLFESELAEAEAVGRFEQALLDATGKTVGVLIRSATALRDVLAANPFPEAAPSMVGVLFLPAPPPADVFETLVIPGPEDVRASGREVFVHYPSGMGRSKLRLPPALSCGTMRNINTVTKLVALAAK